MSDIEKYENRIFESIKHTNEYGIEFWYARELSSVLEYSQWRNFKEVISKAKESCRSSNNLIEDHFADVSKMVELGSGSSREVDDIELSRYACYLIVQNGDSRKKTIAYGQTYFALQTRKQELAEQFAELDEDRKRVAIRNELKEHNKQLVDAASDAGIKTHLEYAIFQNHGYKGLYGGLDAKDIHKKKGLKKNHKILDFMGSTELAANLFRATQTEERIKRENIVGKSEANKVHFEVGATVRKTIKELGGEMPENLPTPDESVKSIEKQIIDNNTEKK